MAITQTENFIDRLKQSDNPFLLCEKEKEYLDLLEMKKDLTRKLQKKPKDKMLMQTIRQYDNAIKKLVKKFQANSIQHLVIIFLVFALSGSGSLFISSPILKALSLEELISSYPLYIFVRIILIIPIYQLLLIIIASLFGQFNYFWKFEKKFLKRLKIIK